MKKILIILWLASFLISCKEKTLKPLENMDLTIAFLHKVDNERLFFDTVTYFNAVGNEYSVTEIKYFISQICFFKNGKKYAINPNVHYVDTKIPTTLFFTVNSLDYEKYDSLSFIFGFKDEENFTNRFLNPPQNAMSWPSVLGGGYHYMMLNGKYKQNDTLKAMNIHLGRGQIYKNDSLTTDSIIGFLDNSFQVVLPCSEIFCKKNDTIFIEMNVNNWFSNPYNYDISYFGSHIMQNQVALQILKENGKKDVFSLRN